MKARLATCFFKIGHTCFEFLFLSTEVRNDEVFHPTTSTHSSEVKKPFPIGIERKRGSDLPSKMPSQSSHKLSPLGDISNSRSILTDFSRVNTVTVVAANYKGETCLACLLRVHEVLLVSTVDNYLWMVERKGNILKCECNWEATGKKIQHFKKGPLRPIPYDWARSSLYLKVGVYPSEMSRIESAIELYRLPIKSAEKE
ncbi:unnamed protein product [Albugo candida]|uniref:Uncharacterized protein n=1 Tax=Albugo candida TaxID=65357 RepID=A0A024GB01_9STRA|nr:unnamed protein product [Albugo candida]|eukprot:CCI43725.1 unnamed protein product [Albugo candida]